MSFLLYIGTAKELQPIEFIEDSTYLSLGIPTEKELTALHTKINKPYIYYVDAFEGCGCGFACSVNELFEEDLVDDEHDNKCIQSCTELLQLLKSISQYDLPELYCCWEGEWYEDIKTSKSISLASLTIESYPGINEREFISFIP